MATIVVHTNDIVALREAVEKEGLAIGEVVIEYIVRIPVPPERLEKEFPPQLLWRIKQVSGVSFAAFARRAEETTE